LKAQELTEPQLAEEKSFFALGVDLETAKNLGICYQQNAIVWAGADAVPKLILLR